MKVDAPWQTLVVVTGIIGIGVSTFFFTINAFRCCPLFSWKGILPFQT